MYHGASFRVSVQLKPLLGSNHGCTADPAICTKRKVEPISDSIGLALSWNVEQVLPHVWRGRPLNLTV